MTEPAEIILKDRVIREMTRRQWVAYMTVGWGSLALLGGLSAAGLIEFLLPGVLYEPPTNFKVGLPEHFPEGITKVPGKTVFIVRQGNLFHAMSSTCTHLRCQVSQVGKIFQCPCHGSKFDSEGRVIGGAATRSLEWYDLTLAENGEIRVDTKHKVPLGTTFSFIG